GLAALAVGAAAAGPSGALDILGQISVPARAPQDNLAAQAEIVDLTSRALKALKVEGQGTELRLSFRADADDMARASALVAAATQNVRTATLRLQAQNDR